VHPQRRVVQCPVKTKKEDGFYVVNGTNPPQPDRWPAKVEVGMNPCFQRVSMERSLHADPQDSGFLRKGAQGMGGGGAKWHLHKCLDDL
jgi:hypothetical protein